MFFDFLFFTLACRKWLVSVHAGLHGFIVRAQELDQWSARTHKAQLKHKL